MNNGYAMETPDTRFSLIGRLHDTEDVEAWNEFVELYQPLVFSFARRRGMQHADAAEVTQDVLARVSQVIDKWDPDKEKGSFRGWLYRITRNLTIDHLRLRARRPRNLHSSAAMQLNEVADPIADDSSAFEHEYERQLFGWAAKRVKHSFHAKTWQAFWQTAVLGRDVSAVAAELGMTAGAIYVARSRVIKKLSYEIQSRSGDSLI